MSGRELVVLGTASQVPARSRNHHGQVLHGDNVGLLAGPGEGTGRQLLSFALQPPDARACEAGSGGLVREHRPPVIPPPAAAW